MDNIEAAQMSFDVQDWSNSTDVVTTSDVSEVSWFVADPADDLVVFKIIFDGISFIDIWVWESDGSGVVGDDVWDLVRADGFFGDLTEFEVGFWTFNADEGESTLFIIQKSVAFASFDDVQDIHNSDWEFSISSDFIVDSESCLFILSDNGDLSAVSC